MIFKKKFCFFHFPLFNPLASFDLNLLEKGWTKYFKNGLKSFQISYLSICTVYLFWVRTLIQMSSPDRGDVIKLLSRQAGLRTDLFGPHMPFSFSLDHSPTHYRLQNNREAWKHSSSGLYKNDYILCIYYVSNYQAGGA